MCHDSLIRLIHSLPDAKVTVEQMGQVTMVTVIKISIFEYKTQVFIGCAENLFFYLWNFVHRYATGSYII